MPALAVGAGVHLAFNGELLAALDGGFLSAAVLHLSGRLADAESFHAVEVAVAAFHNTATAGSCSGPAQCMAKSVSWAT